MDSEPAESKAVEVAVLGEKRPAAALEDGGGTGRKRIRSGGGAAYEAEMRKIAEIVLVLSAMGTMRGGREPTNVEKSMMSEARAKVVSICEDLAPKDIMPREVFGGIIEDLGFNRLREQQRLGFRAPKPSIAQKMDISMRHMGKAKTFTPQAAVDSTQRAPSGVPTAIRPFTSDKGSHMPTSVGSSQHSSPMGHVTPATSTILSFQPSSSQVSAPEISTGLPNSNVGRDSLATARVERPHLRSDGKINGPSQNPQVPAGFVLKTTTALQSQSTPSSNISTKIKLPDHPPVKMQGNANLRVPQVNSQATHVQTSNSTMPQAVPGALPSIFHPIQGMHFVHAATLMNHHPEISKIVQKMLHLKPAEHPSWTPPSRDYMSKSLTCQMCKLIINEVDNMLVCDACEKGFHLKCPQSRNQKFVPRGEWYCPRCMTISGGKPFPPKYGRVTRNMLTSKITSDSAAVQSPPEKKVETQDLTANQQKIVTNTKPEELRAPYGGIVVELTEVKALQRNEAHGSELSAVTKKEAPNSASCPDEKQQLMGASCVSHSAGSLESIPIQHVLKPEASQCEEKVKTEHTVSPPVDPSALNTSDPLIVSNSHSNVDHAGALNGAGVLPEQNNDSNQLDNHSEKYDGKKADDYNPTCNFNQNDQDVGQEKQIVETAVSTELQGSGKSSEDLHNVDWIGDVHVVDNKKLYQSCRIDGVVFKLQDYALVQASNGKVIPSKLQAMWEDSQTGSRWVAVNRCYFPDDMPATVGRPSAPEGNEVYESNDERTVMAGSINGPCDVLPTKILGEMNSDRPIFSCRWFYDKFKGVFCPIPS